MPLLGELRIVERLFGMLEIAAAVLPVRVEKKHVELLIEIVSWRFVARQESLQGEARSRTFH